VEIIEAKDELRQQLDDWRQQGDHIAIVPTMGNLHVGHISLVEMAREHAERVVVTVFVNPTQFGGAEDFADYPRTLERDTLRLKKIGADILFVPNVETIYPFGFENSTTVSVPGLSENFCGSFRPGHFEGVTSVVARLFALVQPDVAVFGQKDYQQQVVIRRMAADLNLPINILVGATIREDDGLAMSSRNQYLTDDERLIAPALYRSLTNIGEQLQAGKQNHEELQQQAIDELVAVGFKPDYLAIRRAHNLDAPDRDCDELVILVAAHLGNARLIDNIVVTV
jgi:pantoate--beta-alanine ligase